MALEPLCKRGIRVLFYLHDLIVMAPSKERAVLHMVQLVQHLSALGFAINWQKSSPLPSQLIVYMGVHMDSSTMRAKLSPARLEALNSLLSPLHHTDW